MSTLQRWLIFAAMIAVGMTSIITWRFLAGASYFTAIKLEVTAQCSPLYARPDRRIENDRVRSGFEPVDRRLRAVPTGVRIKYDQRAVQGHCSVHRDGDIPRAVDK